MREAVVLLDPTDEKTPINQARCSVHDMVTLEKRGLATVFVASSEFVEAADVQAKALGFDPARVFVPHPIQDRTDAEVQELARDAFQDILKAVCR